jgi:hypothetical protein
VTKVAFLLVSFACSARSGSGGQVEPWKRHALGDVSVEVPADYLPAVDRDGNRLKIAKAGEGAAMLERNVERFAGPAECQASIGSVEGGTPCRAAGVAAVCSDVRDDSDATNIVHFVYFCAGSTEYKLVVGDSKIEKQIPSSLRIDRN